MITTKMSSDVEKMVSCSEEEFDSNLQKISTKDLVLIISKLQAAILTEQEHFSSLHNRIEQLPDQSGPEHASLSEELVKSQGKIGLLMQRNMKCFNAKTETEKASKTVMDKSASHSKPQKSDAKPPVKISETRKEAPYLKKQTPQPKGQAPPPPAPVSVDANDTKNGSKAPKSILKKPLPSTIDATCSSSSSMSTEKQSMPQMVKGSQSGRHNVNYSPPMKSKDPLTSPPRAAKSSTPVYPSHDHEKRVELPPSISCKDDAVYPGSEHAADSAILLAPANPDTSVNDPEARMSPAIPVTNIDDFDVSDDDAPPPLPASPPPGALASNSPSELESALALAASTLEPAWGENSSHTSKAHVGNVESYHSVDGQDMDSKSAGNTDKSPSTEVKPSDLSSDAKQCAKMSVSQDRDTAPVSFSVSETLGKKSKMVSIVPGKKESPPKSPEIVESLPVEGDLMTLNPDKNGKSYEGLDGLSTTPPAEPQDVKIEPVRKRRMMFETGNVTSSAVSNSSKGKMATVRPKSLPSQTNTRAAASLPEGKTVTVRPKSVPALINSHAPPVKGKMGTAAATSPSNGPSSGLQGKMVSVVPRKKEVKSPSSAVASSATVVLQNGPSMNGKLAEPSQRAGNCQAVTVRRVSGSHAIDVSAEDMMRDEVEMDYALSSVTVKAKSQMGKMASFKKDKNDNDNLKGSVDVPDDNGVTVAVPVTDFEGQGMLDDDDDELVKERTTLLHWDPVKLLDDLYEIKQVDDHAEDPSSGYIQMAGYMDKLPMNKKKATMLKTWKKRYFRAKDGNLFYYDGNHSDRPSGFIQLMGGSVEDAENRMIGIDDGRGHYCLLRCPTDREHQDWMVALNSQVAGSPLSRYVKPALNPKQHFRKKVVIIDIGGCSVRGGVLGMEPSLPQVFFPAVVAINKTTGEKFFGAEAFQPEIRSQSNLMYPLRKSPHVDKVNLDKEILPGLVKKVFNELKRHPSMYHLLLCTPFNLSAKTVSNLLDSLLEEYQLKAISIFYQPIMALYSYSVTSGIVVDIGERCDVVPVIDGFLMTAGISRQPYGAVAITELLNQNLAEHKFRFHTDVERLLTRLALERACYVSQNFQADNEKCFRERESFVEHIDLTKYELPEDTFTELTCDSGRFRAAEGLFDTELFGQDTPFLHKVVNKAIQDCPMDSRREMCRSIYLSGGTTMLPGFPERLKTLLETLVPKSCVVEVHASPHRYHAAYIGACVQAGLEGFEQSCITLKEWRSNPQDCMRRLQSF